VVSYTYDPAVQNSNADVLDAIPVVVTDVLGNSTPGSLDITITDSKPVAQNDANAVTEDTALTASGNVLLGAGADTVGADANATPVTPASVALTYGSLVLNSRRQLHLHAEQCRSGGQCAEQRADPDRQLHLHADRRRRQQLRRRP
jgi:hypothetical protein